MPSRIAEVVATLPPLTLVATAGGVRAMASPMMPVRAEIEPLSPGRHALGGTVSDESRRFIEEIEELQGHAGPLDLERVLNPALRMYVEHLRKRKFGVGRKPRPQQRASRSVRYVPDPVKRAVWERDGGRCTFESDTGHRCEERKNLEFDHIEPVARGGRSVAGNLRLRCRAHNQFTAEQTFGAGFMERKREEARTRAAVKSAAGTNGTNGTSHPTGTIGNGAGAATAGVTPPFDVIPALRSLGYRATEAKAASAYCDTFPDDASPEARVRRALTYFRPHGQKYSADGRLVSG